MDDTNIYYSRVKHGKSTTIADGSKLMLQTQNAHNDVLSKTFPQGKVQELPEAFKNQKFNWNRSVSILFHSPKG